jgi:hypothetical protein
MKITREQLRNIVGEVLQEEKDYASFFQAMLKKHGVSSPDEFKSDEEKKAFFNKVEDTWKGVSERLTQLKEDELTAKQQKIDLNKNGKVDGDDLSKLRAGTKTEAELSAAQQKIDLNKNGKVDGDDLSKLRAGAKTEGGEEQLSQTKILSKEGETLVKSGAGKMYNITKVNESKEADILAKIEKLRLDAEAGKIKTLDQFLDKFKPLQKQLKALGESVNEAANLKTISMLFQNKGIKDAVRKDHADKLRKIIEDSGVSTKGVSDSELIKVVKQLTSESVEGINEATLEQGTKLRYDKNSNVVDYVVDKKYTGRDGFPKYILKVVKSNYPNKIKVGSTEEYDDSRLTGLIRNRVMSFVKNESVNEGRYDADLDKIEAAVKNATSFMNVGSELKKAGIKYDFTTSMIPMYMIKVSGNTIAVVNKKYAAGAEREVKDIAIGLLN